MQPAPHTAVGEIRAYWKRSIRTPKIPNLDAGLCFTALTLSLRSGVIFLGNPTLQNLNSASWCGKTGAAVLRVAKDPESPNSNFKMKQGVLVKQAVTAHNGSLWVYRSLSFCRKDSQEMVLWHNRGKLFVPPEEPAVRKGMQLLSICVTDIRWFCIQTPSSTEVSSERRSLCVCTNAMSMCAIIFWSDKEVSDILCWDMDALNPCSTIRDLHKQQSFTKCTVEHREKQVKQLTKSCGISASMSSLTWVPYSRSCPWKHLAFKAACVILVGIFIGVGLVLCGFPQTILSCVFAVSNSNCIPDIAVGSRISQNWVSSISSYQAFDSVLWDVVLLATPTSKRTCFFLSTILWHRQRL